MQGGYGGYDYGGYGSRSQGNVPAAVADAAQSLPAESQQKLANIVAKVSVPKLNFAIAAAVIQQGMIKPSHEIPSHFM